MSKLDKYVKFIPKELKPHVNPMLNALLSAWAGADDELMVQLQNAKAQLFVKTAEGRFLDRLASNYGVARPSEIGLLDEDFQNLIPNLSFKPKAIAKSFYDTMDVFWGPLFSRVNATSTLAEPYAISVGDTFTIIVDGGAPQSVTVKPGDTRLPGGATAREVIFILSQFKGITVEAVLDPVTLENRLNIRTNTPGLRGSIEFVEGFAALGFTLGVKYKISSLTQRSVIYQVSAGEVVIEIPAIVPVLRRTLKGSHHFHETSAIEPVIPPAIVPWQGSFFYSTQSNPFVATSIRSTLLAAVLKGSIQNQLSVADTSAFPATGGNLIFDFGKSTEEQPVKFTTATNSNTLLIDPGYSFQHTHETGSYINLLMPGQTTPYAPNKDGSDFGIYMTSPANARDKVEEIIRGLAAAGITVTFVVLLPSYTYLIDNPYAT